MENEAKLFINGPLFPSLYIHTQNIVGNCFNSIQYMHNARDFGNIVSLKCRRDDKVCFFGYLYPYKRYTCVVIRALAYISILLL